MSLIKEMKFTGKWGNLLLPTARISPDWQLLKPCSPAASPNQVGAKNQEEVKGGLLDSPNKGHQTVLLDSKEKKRKKKERNLL